jgi:transposase
MLSLSSACRYYLYRLPADMRKGADRLSGLVRDHMQKDPLSGAIFIFINRKRDQVKLLHWEGDGFSIYCKRLEEGQYELPAIHTTATSITLTSDELHMILRGIVLYSIKKHKRYRRMVNKNVDENQQAAHH